MYSCISFLSCTHSSPLILCSSIYTLPSSRTPTAHPSFSSPSTSCHHPAPHPPSDVLPATPGSYFICCTTHIWRNTNTSCLTSCGMWVNTTGHNNDIVSCCYFFVTFLYNFKIALGFLHFPREFFGIMSEDWYDSLPFELFWERPSSDFNFTVLLSHILHTCQTIFEWYKQKII